MTDENLIQQLQVVLVGAGNLATNLGKAMHSHGFHILQVYSRTEESAALLANQLQAAPVTDLALLSPDADLYIVALKDACLQTLIPDIVRGKKSEALFVHTAGSLPMDIWKGHAAHYGVFYPLMTFSKQRSVHFEHISFFVEAAQRSDVELLKATAGVLSEKVYEADSRQRKQLHLAAVFANNFSNHMYTLAGRLLEKSGLPFDALLPLIDETVRKVHELSPIEAQTGPAVRYDENVMNDHLSMLSDDVSMQQIYELVSRSIHEHHS